MTIDLFETPEHERAEAIGPGSFVLHGFVRREAPALIDAVQHLSAQSPFRQMVTPGGFTMSVALTNCGALGWTTDRRGYRYTALDPQHGRPWPAMPPVLADVARRAAAAAGFTGFSPDACLVNEYIAGARMSLHQDKDEHDLSAPIVSVSLGMPAVFLFGGLQRSDKPVRIALAHGDVVVWGGPDRLRFHGVMPLKDQPHSVLGSRRINLTFRKAG